MAPRPRQATLAGRTRPHRRAIARSSPDDACEGFFAPRHRSRQYSRAQRWQPGAVRFRPRLLRREMPTSRASNSPKRRPPISTPGCARPVKLKDKSAPPHQRLPSRRAPRPPRGAMGGAPQMPSPRGRPPAPGRGAAERAGAGCSTTPHARTAPGAPVGRPPVDASASERNFSAGSCRRPEFAG